MKYVVTIKDKNYEVEVEKGVAQVLNISSSSIQANQVNTATVSTPLVTPTSQSLVAGEVLLSPMPGVIVAIKKSTGEKVLKGDTILILEAMKMENEITATKDGIISQVVTVKGASVNTGDPLVVVS